MVSVTIVWFLCEVFVPYGQKTGFANVWSLKAAHANASDVFVFWLAIAATLNDLFSKPMHELPGK